MGTHALWQPLQFYPRQPPGCHSGYYPVWWRRKETGPAAPTPAAAGKSYLVDVAKVIAVDQNASWATS